MARFDSDEGVLVSEQILLDLQALVPEWADEALCIGEWELFDVDFGSGRQGQKQQQQMERAIAICNTCPVKQKCLDDALAAEAHYDPKLLAGIYTIRGGTTPRQRAAIHAQRNRNSKT